MRLLLALLLAPVVFGRPPVETATSQAKRHLDVFFKAIEANDKEAVMKMVHDGNREYVDAFMASLKGAAYSVVSADFLSDTSMNAKVAVTAKGKSLDVVTFVLVRDSASPSGWQAHGVYLTLPKTSEQQRRFDASDIIICWSDLFRCTVNIFATILG